jgi:hypothetical protein
MKAPKARKSSSSQNGKARRGVVSKALRFVGDHKAAAAGVLAAGVGAYAILRRGKKGAAKSPAAGKTGRTARRGKGRGRGAAGAGGSAAS